MKKRQATIWSIINKNFICILKRISLNVYDGAKYKLNTELMRIIKEIIQAYKESANWIKHFSGTF